MELSPNALAVLEARYLERLPAADGTSTHEAPATLFRRVAHHVAAAEALWSQGDASLVSAWEEKFHELLTQGLFLPNSPTLMNAGRELGLLSACFVLPIEDSIASIFETLRDAALIQKAGGGTGFDFSKLRPRGDLVRSSGGKATGPVSFLRVYGVATAAIQQGAFRRGANMGILRIDHPDILEFIDAKQDLQALTNFNISVAITDDFMRRLDTDPSAPHRVRNPRTGDVSVLEADDRRWSVGEVFHHLATRAWASGEPGVVFLDRLQRDNMTPALGNIEATNPCSEQPLLPHEACTLGSINLARLVGPDGIHWEKLRATAQTAVRFLDDVVEVNRYPVPQTEKMCRATRKIGLGVMGFADALFELKVPYDSPAAARLGEEIMSTLDATAHQASEDLARARGVFPAWPGSRWDLERGRLQRHATVTTVAPTGTISIIAGCSAGIEPLFSLVFTRNILDGQRLLEINPVFAREATRRGLYSPELVERILRTGTLQGLAEIPADMQRVFVTARDIAPTAHVRMQAAFQRHCDTGISKTINFPGTATVEDVQAIYLEAYRAQVKGVTVYRDASRPHQPMALQHCQGCE